MEQQILNNKEELRAEDREEIRAQKKAEEKRQKLLMRKLYHEAEIRPGRVVIEGIGKRPIGSSLYILRELVSGDYGDLEIIYPVRTETMDVTRQILAREGMENVRVVPAGSDEYREALFTAQFLFNEVTFPVWWIRKPGQVFAEIWHGTPLKRLGKAKKGPIHKDAAGVHAFTAADYVLMPNDYSLRHILGDMGVLDITPARAVMLGYPRTGVLRDEQLRQTVRQALGIESRRVCAWMPTWNDDTDIEQIGAFLRELEEGMEDDLILYVNFHHRTGLRMDFGDFNRIRPFPEEYDIYELLAAADVLITDYSSVFYDFAFSGRKVILHCPDRETYTAERGLYMELEDLPFPVTSDADGLLKEMKAPRDYDDTEFLAAFNGYDSGENARKLCQLVVLGRTEGLEIRDLRTDDEKVFIAVDSFSPGKLSDWLMDIHRKGLWDPNHILSFPEKAAEDEIDRIEPLLRGVPIFPTKGKIMDDSSERRRLFGEIRAKKFVLMDPGGPARIRAFASFPEPVEMLLTDRQMTKLRDGDPRLRKALKAYSDSGKQISVLDPADADWLKETMGTTATVVSTEDAFLKRYFG